MLGSYTRVFTVVQMLLNLFSAKQNSFNVTVAYQRINSDFHLLMWFEVAWIISCLCSHAGFRLQLVKPWIFRFDFRVFSCTSLNIRAEIVTNPNNKRIPRA